MPARLVLWVLVVLQSVVVDGLIPPRRPGFVGSSCWRPVLLHGTKPSASDKELVEAVEVAFAEVRAEEDDAAASPSGAGDGNGDYGSGAKTEIKTKVAKALGVEESGGEPTSRTLQRVQELSEEASIAFVKARDYLEFVKIYIEDRVERDSALLMATIEYVRQRSVLDTRRVLSAAAEATRPVLLLAEAVTDPSKRSNLTLTEGLVLMQSGVSPLQRARRLEAFRFNDDEERRINAAYRKQLSARPAAPTPINLLKATASAPIASVEAASAAADLAYRAKRRVIDRIPGEQTRDTVEKLKPFLPAAVNEGVANFLGSAGSTALPPAADEVDRDIYALPEKNRKKKTGQSTAPRRALPPTTTGATRPKRWGGAEAQRVEEERVARRKAARLEVEKLIADRELSGITAMAAAAVAATEEANEAETLDRLSAAQESARPLSRAFRQNSTREEATMRSLRQVLEGTQQVVSKWCTG
jgi:hypothetical protein